MKYEFVKSPHYTPVDKKLIVIHWVAGTGQGCINWMTNPKSKVSAHYVIDRQGKITQMVEEQDIAWHAGVSSLGNYPTTWEGKEWSSLNPCSIGIELAGPPSSVEKMSCWPGIQIDSLVSLCKDIATRHPGIRITDHSTISPDRKIDVKTGTGRPEDIFPWRDFITATGMKEA